jgi:hypothetical protein
MRFFAKIDSNDNVLEYPVPEGILIKEYPEIAKVDENLDKFYDETKPLPSGYVLVHHLQIEYDWIEYEYSEGVPTKGDDGKWYKNHVPTPRSPESRQEMLDYKSSEVRKKRDELLAKSDWTVMPDSPIPDAIKQQWIEYRKFLREIPQQSEFPKIVNWPIQP